MIRESRETKRKVIIIEFISSNKNPEIFNFIEEKDPSPLAQKNELIDQLILKLKTRE